MYFHITSIENVPNILLNGIENRNNYGICVCTTNNENVIEYITETMLATQSNRFAVFLIDPTWHRIRLHEIIRDNTHEFTNTLHRYILRDRLNVTEADYIQSYILRSNGIPDIQILQHIIRETGLVV